MDEKTSSNLWLAANELWNQGVQTKKSEEMLVLLVVCVRVEMRMTTEFQINFNIN